MKTVDDENSMTRTLFQRRLSLLLANLLLPVAVLVFASGFFPYKPFLPGLATFEELGHGQQQPEAPFDRLIFMVVDALRSDFVYGHGTGFEYTQSLIRSGAAIPFTAHATPPTVTMPRVKALTTGSVPSFLDLILNFAESDTSSSLATQDTWLAQLRARPNSTLVFYGDDTWLKLFPGDFFARHDGTSSFFVSDFTEVDHNVTRHVPEELGNEDWSAMIMHYLGLDHIGHKTGPQGPNMLPKQKEMDGIVRVIYEAMERYEHHEKTLLVVAGDHGMNAGGNHGGSGPGETEPALLFVSPRLKEFEKKREYECPTLPKDGTDFHFYTKMEQSDVVPMLAALLGLPIPRNSLGVCMSEIMGFWRPQDHQALLRQNVEQLLHIVKAAVGEEHFNGEVGAYAAMDKVTLSTACDSTDGWEQELACRLAVANSLESGSDDQIAALYRVLYHIQDNMSSTASSYNIPRMVTGTTISIFIAALSLISLQRLWPISKTGIFLFLTTILYGVMMFASSYVEEEQHFWYWMTPAWIAFIGLRRLSKQLSTQQSSHLTRTAISCVLIIALHRLAIRWNQTGQKHAGAPDIVHTVFPDHYHIMWVLILSTYMFIGYRISFVSFEDILPREAAAPYSIILLLAAIIFKLNFTQADAPELVGELALQLREWSADLSLVLQARIVFLLLAIATLSIVLLGMIQQGQSSKSRSVISTAARLQPILSLFLATQTRAPNVPLLLIMDIQGSILTTLLSPDVDKKTAKSSKDETFTGLDIAAISLLLSYTTYFCFGGSNSISSLDLSNAYNGVADYNIAAVGVLLFSSNWTGPVWWAFFAVVKLLPAIDNSPVNTSGPRSWVEQERNKLHNDAMAAVKQNSSSVAEAEVKDEWLTYMAILTSFFAASLVAVMAACTALRTHLFIWTVFSPKYLYAMAWSVGWHFLINGCVGGLLRFAATS